MQKLRKKETIIKFNMIVANYKYYLCDTKFKCKSKIHIRSAKHLNVFI